MVSLVRQPDNRYDPNAVRVDNVSGVQVGHIKRELAKPLASVMDRRLARVEGSAFSHYHVKKTAPFYFYNSFVKTASITTIFGTHILQ